MKNIKRHVFAIAGFPEQNSGVTFSPRISDRDYDAIRRRNLAVYNGVYPLNKRVVIAGCGGGGWWIAKFLAVAMAVRELHLYDTKVLEPFHMLRMDVPKCFLGENKAVALGALIRETVLLDSMRVFAYPRAFTPEDELFTRSSRNGNIRIIDATDSYATHVALSAAFSPTNRYLRVSYNGKDHATISNITSTFRSGAAPTGYEVEQLDALTAMRVAAHAMPYIMGWLLGAPDNVPPVKVRVSKEVSVLHPKGVMLNE